MIIELTKFDTSYAKIWFCIVGNFLEGAGHFLEGAVQFAKLCSRGVSLDLERTRLRIALRQNVLHASRSL